MIEKAKSQQVNGHVSISLNLRKFKDVFGPQTTLMNNQSVIKKEIKFKVSSQGQNAKSTSKKTNRKSPSLFCEVSDSKSFLLNLQHQKTKDVISANLRDRENGRVPRQPHIVSPGRLPDLEHPLLQPVLVHRSIDSFRLNLEHIANNNSPTLHKNNSKSTSHLLPYLQLHSIMTPNLDNYQK
jgi:hypothetical protein